MTHSSISSIDSMRRSSSLAPRIISESSISSAQNRRPTPLCASPRIPSSSAPSSPDDNAISRVSCVSSSPFPWLLTTPVASSLPSYVFCRDISLSRMLRIPGENRRSDRTDLELALPNRRCCSASSGDILTTTDDDCSSADNALAAPIRSVRSTLSELLPTREAPRFKVLVFAVITLATSLHDRLCCCCCWSCTKSSLVCALDGACFKAFLLLSNRTRYSSALQNGQRSRTPCTARSSARRSIVLSTAADTSGKSCVNLTPCRLVGSASASENEPKDSCAMLLLLFPAP
mmetsp:Transcript_17750/g.38491  ORF Transcript_17750/g.38491 Transcript_17750/m.38491 type:complete len:289 (+) Transcript_17750:240-1106(+)